jgi:hypothetical protein
MRPFPAPATEPSHPRALCFRRLTQAVAAYGLLALLVSLLGCNQLDSESSDPTQSSQASDPLGGQAGDDGDLTPDEQPPDIVEPGPVSPGVDALDNCDVDESTLSADERSVFGVSAVELIEHLELTESPLFWFAEEDLPGTEYLPGPGETSVSFTLEIRQGEDLLDAERVVQFKRVPRMPDDHCEPHRVSIPVWASLSTSDGALNERVAATLDFRTAFFARLEFEIKVEDIAGGFQFTQLGALEPGQIWEADSLYVEATFGPGGSRGHINASFDWKNPPEVATPPDMATTAPPGEPAREPNVIVQREHSPYIAIWPSDGECLRQGAPMDPDARLIGISPNQVLDTWAAHQEWMLQSELGDAAVRFSIEPLDEQVCVSGSDDSMRFEVRARLSAASDAAPGLNGLDITAVYELRAQVDPLEGTLRQLSAAPIDTVFDKTRSEFEQFSHLQLELPEEYQRFWWTWQIQLARDAASEDWTSSGEFVVSSLNAEQTAEYERTESQGGPGPGVGIRNDGGWELPGDLVVHATATHAP